MRRLLPLALLCALLSAQDRLRERIDAEAAVEEELAQKIDLDLQEEPLGAALAFLETLSGRQITAPEETLDSPVGLILRDVELWTVLRVLAATQGLALFVDLDGGALRLAAGDEVARLRLAATLAPAEHERVLAAPDGLPPAPAEVAESAPGCYRVPLGEGVDFRLEEGAGVLLDASGAVLLDQDWRPEPDPAERAVQEQLDMLVSLRFDGPLGDRVELLRAVTGLPIVMSSTAFEAAAGVDRPPLIITDGELRVAVRHLAKMYGLGWCVRDGVVLIGSEEETAERILGLRCLGPDGAERWSVPLRLPGGGEILSLRVGADAVYVYTRSADGDELHVFARDDGTAFVRIPLDD